ncbi:T9SS C-terminal target domain-containing protein [uncultured Chryseobacterium sp.]|uniref:T9SS C-terminal target domain-containing protein n=1 Tax=uncultured Chryseobacterium sp. TaxID=259322 RepID=UPI0025E4D964|nr:T9SS C-terminal target domain-containing protein [uncultured Chryseobacterium sp.]
MKNKIITQLFVLLFLLAGFLSIEAQIPGMPAMALKEAKNVFGGADYESATSIFRTTDGGVVVAGSTGSNNGDVSGNHGDQDMWVVKFNASGAIQWQKTLGGTGEDIAYSVIQTADGGYAVAGSSNSNDGDVSGNNGNQHMWVVKLNPMGTIQWQQVYGGVANTAYANSIIQNSDGGYAVAGRIYSSTNGTNVFVLKLGVTGNVEWQKEYGGSEIDYGYSIIQTTDGGYAVAGFTKSNNGDVSGNHGGLDMWIIKITATGTKQWAKAFGGSGYDAANSIIQTSDGGYAVAGYTGSNDGNVSGNHGQNDMWVVKLSAAGNLEWQKPLGNVYSDQANSIIQVTDGGYVVVGASSNISNGNSDLFIVKLNSTGDILWQKIYGGTGADSASSVIQTTGGGYAVAANIESNNGNVTGSFNGARDFFIPRLDPAGNFIRLYEDIP